MRLSVVAACLFLCFIGFSSAQDAHASIRKDTNIPAEGLGPALNALAKDRNFQIVYVTEEIANVRTEGAVGEFTTEEALKRLLNGTGLTYRYLDDKTVTIGSAIMPHERSGHAARATSSGPADDRSYNQEGRKSSSDGFRVAQVDQGTSPQSFAVGKNTSTPEGSNRGGLEEIVVTAQRRSEDINKVPISLTALSQRAMDDLHIQSFSDLATIVPGLDAPPSTPLGQGSADLAIRGIFSSGNAPTTGIYIDETPIAIRVTAAAAGGNFQPDIFDLARVEVLRGPQGTLFGSGAMGGVIRFITPEPNLNESSGYVKTEIASTERGQPSYAVGVAYGSPIVQGVAGFRVSGWFHSDGGFVDIEDPFTGKIVNRNANASDSYTLRPAFTLVPAKGLTVTAALYVQHERSDAPPDYWTNLLPNPESGAHVSGALLSQPLRDDIKVPSLSVKYDLPGMSLQSDTSYLDRWFYNADDGTQLIEEVFNGGVPFIPGVPPSYTIASTQLGGTKAWQQQFRLTSAEVDSRLHWVLGLYYRHAQETQSQLISPSLTPIFEALYGPGVTSEGLTGIPDYVVHGQPLMSYTWFRTVDEQKAFFGEASVNVTARLKATVGVRVEHSAVEQQRQIVAGPFNGLAYSNTVLPDQVQTPITPRFALTYQYTDTGMIYATASKGYRAGGGNSVLAVGNSACGESLTALGLSSVPKSFTSDSLWSYELGAKDSLFDGRLAVQTSVFYIDWSNIQTSISLPSCAEGFTANRGRAVSRGFDVQIAVVPMTDVELGANAGYTDAYYRQAQYGAPQQLADGSFGPTPLLNGAGDKLASVLPWTASAHAEYSRDIGTLWKDARAYFRADYRWLGAMPKANPNVAGYDPGIASSTLVSPNPAYEILNLRLGVIRGGLDLSAFVDNATNSDPRLGYLHGKSGNQLYYATANRPLTAGLTALYRF